MIAEEWGEIFGFPTYRVSNFGRVVNTVSGRILKNTIGSENYLRIGLYSETAKNKKKLVHRLVGEAFLENPENKPEINHIDGDKQNNVIFNLEWCTSSENQKHAYSTGLQISTLQGVGHFAAKISSKDVRMIRILGAIGIKQKSIGKRFGINQQNVSLICSRKAWKHI